MNGTKTWGWTGVLLAAGLSAGATLAFLSGGAVIMALAYGAVMGANLILRIIQTPFVPLMIVAKLIGLVDGYVEKRKKINNYLDAGSREANEIRTAEAEKIMRSLERVDSDTSQHMPEDLRKEMIEYFSDEKRDLGTLMETAKKMENLAKQQKSIRTAYMNGSSEPGNVPSGMKAILLSEINQSSSSSASSGEPKHNNYETYRTVHN